MRISFGPFTLRQETGELWKDNEPQRLAAQPTKLLLLLIDRAEARCFELLVEDVRSLLREWGGRKGQPTAVCIDSRTLQSTPESGGRAGYGGAKRRRSSPSRKTSAAKRASSNGRLASALGPLHSPRP